jgi:hypothetical protein
VSLGWRVSQEPFLKNQNLIWLSDLKLRASYGVVGKTEIGDFPFAGL